MNYLPMVATSTALMECIRFSASSNTTLWRLRNTSSVTSRMSTPLSCHSLASLVSKSWKEGRQCRYSTLELPVAFSVSSVTR